MCDHLWKMAQTFAKSEFVPKAFVGKPANVFVALQIAARAKMDPFMCMQNLYVIAGKPAMEAKMAIALLNASGKTRGPVRYTHEGMGKERKCTATVIDAETGQPISHTLHWATVEMSGWVAKGGAWAQDPLLMLKYRAAYQLIRTTYPEVLLGMYTVEEAREVDADDSMVAFWDQRNHGAQRNDQAVETIDAQVVAETSNPAAEDEPPADSINRVDA